MDRRGIADLLGVTGLDANLGAVDEVIYGLGRKATSPLRNSILDTVNGGKRLRPALLLASAAAAGKSIPKGSIRAAAAVELVHQASLVHDDIIDESPARRGRPTVFAKEGRDVALLVGDYLLAAGLAEASAVSGPTGKILALAVAEMSAGQAREAKAKPTKLLSAAYAAIARQKAGALFGAACQIGALCGGSPTSQAGDFYKFGQNFGLAFQIVDDILDRDIPNKQSRQASETAKQYSAAAASALKPAAGSPSTETLRLFPGKYLARALGDKE